MNASMNSRTSKQQVFLMWSCYWDHRGGRRGYPW